MSPTDGAAHRLDDLLRREWLITNHLGGYASSTVPSLHGLLVAAMAPPVHRMVLLSRVEEVVHCDGWATPLACSEYPGAIHPKGNEVLRAFSHFRAGRIREVVVAVRGGRSRNRCPWRVYLHACGAAATSYRGASISFFCEESERCRCLRRACSRCAGYA